MAENANVPAQVESPQVEQVTSEVSSTDYREIVKSLIAGGAKRINKLKIKNVTPAEQENYVRVGISLIPSVKGYDSNGEEVETNVIFTSLFALVAIIRENEELAWMGNTLIEKPNLLPLIMCGAEIDILQRHYDSGVEIFNPYSHNKEQTPSVYDHPIYINDVIEIRLSKTGQKMVDKLADKLMGF